MKRYIHYFAIAATLVLALASCAKETLNPESVIRDSRAQETEFDKWLNVNFLRPYNIEVKYRYELMETNLAYWTVPADYKQAVVYAHLLKYLCVDTYDEVAGTEFTCAYFPKLFFMEGTFHYDNNGTMILGTAEGGRKIFLAGINYLNYYLEQAVESKDPGRLSDLYFKTIHHEFTHILNQTKNYSEDFQLISGADYVLSAWNTTRPNSYLQAGFISSYSQHSAGEDFAEMLSTYIITTPEQWSEWMTTAGTAGASKISRKLEFVRNYMLTAWNVDLDKLRDTVLRRMDDVLNERVDLEDLTI